MCLLYSVMNNIISITKINISTYTTTTRTTYDLLPSAELVRLLNTKIYIFGILISI